MVGRSFVVMAQVIVFVILLASLLAWIVAIRPTTESKNYAYFKRYAVVFPTVAVIFGVWFAIVLGYSYKAPIEYLANVMFVVLGVIVMFFLTVFFFIESKQSFIDLDVVKSFGNAVVFVIFNLPGFLILLCIMVIPTIYALSIVAENVVSWPSIINFLVVYVIIAPCILYNYFIQRVNENKSLYW